MLTFDSTVRAGAAATAIILHPHPDMGGDRRHPVVDALYRGLPSSTLRFDFSSSDVEVARAEVAEAIGLAEGPVVLMGYSFGADVALTVTDGRVLGWFLVAPPLRVVERGAMVAARDPRPKRLVVPARDQWSPPALVAATTADWTSATVVTIAGADHFLVGSTGAVLEAALAWLPSLTVDP